MAARAQSVDTAYRRHARELDGRFHTPHGRGTPVLDRLQEFTAVRGLVFGGYGEGSRDVHLLIRACADSAARIRWRLMGARSMVECRAFLIASYRRRVGMAAGRAFARHRLRRVPYIGVPAAALRNRAPPRARQPLIDPHTFYAHQAHVMGHEAAPVWAQ